ncbi:MAG TPA: hypothetical protein VMU32_09645 [Solirubrobacteraceae bacterium]|nr:hypothetical protein [Solirubrobacteraceae bacterium]
MATTQVVLGLLVREAAGRSAILSRYERGFYDRDLLVHDLRRPRLRRDEQGELRLVAQRDSVGTPGSKIDAALVSLRERGLIEVTEVTEDSGAKHARDEVFAATGAGRAHFEWWLGDASTLDAGGGEWWQKLLFCDHRHAPRMIELTRTQELLCLERLEELRCSVERMTFARCSTFEDFWDAMTTDEEPMRMQCTITTVQKARSALRGQFADPGDQVQQRRRALE